MPRPFDEEEQRRIRLKIRQTATELFRRKGVAKTTVEELARGAGIAKGSFYKFYDSKELLFFNILEDLHEEMRAPLLRERPLDSDDKQAAFSSLIRRLLKNAGREPLILYMGRDEDLQAILLRVPMERLRSHERRDQKFISDLINIWSDKDSSPSRDVVAARMTMALLVCLHAEFIGKRLFPHALDAAVEGVVSCFFPLSAVAD